MQFSNIAAAAVLAGIALANNVTITTNIVVTDYTTYCPEPTHVVVNNKTITVTEATTLIVTGPCTIPTTYVSQKPEQTAPEQTTHVKTTPVATAPVSTSKTTVAGESTHASSESTSTVNVVSTIENGAGKVAAGAAAGLAAVFAALV